MGSWRRIKDRRIGIDKTATISRYQASPASKAVHKLSSGANRAETMLSGPRRLEIDLHRKFEIRGQTTNDHIFTEARNDPVSLQLQ